MTKYTVTLWTPMLNDNPHSYELAATEQAKSLREARRIAKRQLGPHRKTTTWELRSHCHAAFSRIERGGVSVESIDAIDYVESIADRLRRGEAVAV